MPADDVGRGQGLTAIVQGSDRSARREAFYAEVMGLPVPGAGLCDGSENGGPENGGPEAEELARLVMAQFDRCPAAKVRKRLSALRVLAASRVRAANGTGRGLRHGSGDVVLHGIEPGFAGFFSLDVASLSYRRFDGAMSAPVRREVLLSGDAVTVLPYDPVRDRVLLIEQMRMGPLGRGDRLPWQIEAIAGRIDPGESPEDCARREAVEEARLTLGRLEKVAEYYPSPGALSEYVYSYVALCDLPDEVVGVFGAEEEAEDIRGFLLTHAELMAALARGELATAPLLLSVLWLDRERPRLRAPGT